MAEQRPNTASRMLSAGRDRASRPPAEPAGGRPFDWREETQAAAGSPSNPPAPGPVPGVRYERAGVYLTPDQRDWLTDTLYELRMRGVSASDLVRLALARLQGDVAGGLDLPGQLIAQAAREAEQLPGRRNRGLPRRRPPR